MASDRLTGQMGTLGLREGTCPEAHSEQGQTVLTAAVGKRAHGEGRRVAERRGNAHGACTQVPV